MTRVRRFSSLILDLSAEFVNTAFCKNQAELASCIRDAHLKDDTVFEAFRDVDRALFLPKTEEYWEPYVNKPLKLGFGTATMSTPIHQALLLSAFQELGLLNLENMRVLDLGCASGWLSASIYSRGIRQNSNGMLLSMERIPELVELAQECLETCPVTQGAQGNGSLVVKKALNDAGEMDLSTIQEFSPFDLIHVGFAFDRSTDAALLEELIGNLRQSPDCRSRLVAGISDQLVSVDREGNEQVIATIPGLVRMDKGQYQPPVTRAQRLDELKQQLDIWKAEFESTNGRKPNRQDLFDDKQAKELFLQYSAISKLSM